MPVRSGLNVRVLKYFQVPNRQNGREVAENVRTLTKVRMFYTAPSK
jgi:hypothetical protein